MKCLFYFIAQGIQTTTRIYIKNLGRAPPDGQNYFEFKGFAEKFDNL